MNIEPISSVASERVHRPVMRQCWRDLTFLHWRYHADDVRRIVPASLEIDTYDGSAWVGLVPFQVAGLTHVNAPAVPWLSNFAETNVRTYVIDSKGKRGVWFFSLDAARLAAVIGARLGFALPYYWSKMQVRCDRHSADYRSARRHGPTAASAVSVEIGGRLATPNELEAFLTARFRLYAMRGDQLLRADVEHAPWPLQSAGLKMIDDTLVQAAGLPSPQGEPLIHFARSLDVLVSGPVPA